MSKQKVKTHSGAKKRFQITASGKIKRKNAFKRHILTKKTSKRKMNLTGVAYIHFSDAKNIRQLFFQ